jgi:hypothetical protein
LVWLQAAIMKNAAQAATSVRIILGQAPSGSGLARV